MKTIKNCFTAYLHGSVVFLIVFYFMTAQPDGRMPLRWNPLNLWWTFSFLCAYPLLRMLIPKITHLNLHLTSFTTRALTFNDVHEPHNTQLYHQSIGPVTNQLDLKGHSQNRDDGFSLMVDLLLSGVWIAVAIPGVILALINKAFTTHQ
ncbi:hypothetical protein [Lactiplantibacillus carotarum]|uniref:hypothetical protein n=1 Tax=Lactiplantibacillus carotarum TaxID=2993456 RepID=UPI00298F35FF|nr:hypothetical protein [Lactiplantibacillus carotarum]